MLWRRPTSMLFVLKCLTHLFGCEFESAYAGILKRFLMDANLYQPYYVGWFLFFLNNSFRVMLTSADVWFCYSHLDVRGWCCLVVMTSYYCTLWWRVLESTDRVEVVFATRFLSCLWEAPVGVFVRHLVRYTPLQVWVVRHWMMSVVFIPFFFFDIVPRFKKCDIATLRGECRALSHLLGAVFLSLARLLSCFAIVFDCGYTQAFLVEWMKWYRRISVVFEVLFTTG